MANQEMLDKLLNGGVEAWNRWRFETTDKQHEIDLSNVDLSNMDLKQVIFAGANLDGSLLSGSELQGANLVVTDLEDTDLTNTNLVGAILTGANLTGAVLKGADLINANLRSAILNETDFSGAILSGTSFGNVDLSVAIGLERADQRGPSTIGIDTIYLSQGNIPEKFLKDAGIPDSFLEYSRSLVGKPIEFYSCFISYSSKDEIFAKRLYADLQSSNVRCWFAPEDLKWGGLIRTGIDEAIQMHDKLLLILSKHSVASGWVEREVKKARAREKKENRTVLFPVRIDDTIFDCPFEWATEVRRERNIGDFTGWKDYDSYLQSYTRLLRDLKTEL